jgi:hypothetical protein
MSPSLMALPPALPVELLTWILNHTAYPTTILICKPRAAFLESLLSSISSPLGPTTPHSPTSNNDLPSSPPNPTTDDTSDPSHSKHPLLLKTLHQISVSRYISLIYIPTVSHYRAYVSVLPQPSKVPAPPDRIWEKKGDKEARLIVYGLVELHRNTSEWSAQGLGRSLAGLVEAGSRDGRGVVCLEEGMWERNDEDLEDEEEVRRRAWSGWNERVPMLNGSVRRGGLGDEDSGWSGRTVEVGRIFAKWFKFGKAEW